MATSSSSFTLEFIDEERKVTAHYDVHSGKLIDALEEATVKAQKLHDRGLRGAFKLVTPQGASTEIKLNPKQTEIKANGRKSGKRTRGFEGRKEKPCAENVGNVSESTAREWRRAYKARATSVLSEPSVQDRLDAMNKEDEEEARQRTQRIKNRADALTDLGLKYAVACLGFAANNGYPSHLVDRARKSLMQLCENAERSKGQSSRMGGMTIFKVSLVGQQENFELLCESAMAAEQVLYAFARDFWLAEGLPASEVDSCKPRELILEFFSYEGWEYSIEPLTVIREV